MDRDGSNIRRITDHAERDDYPIWDPAGETLTAVCERGGKHDLYLIPVRQQKQ